MAAIEYGDSAAPEFVIKADQEAAQKVVQANSPGFLEGAKEAISSEWGFLYALNSKRFAPQPGWEPTPEDIKAATKDVPEDYWGFYERATSPEHLSWLRV